jgi:hypothetical protein
MDYTAPAPTRPPPRPSPISRWSSREMGEGAEGGWVPKTKGLLPLWKQAKIQV